LDEANFVLELILLSDPPIITPEQGQGGQAFFAG